VQTIRARTEQGRSYGGTPFAPLSASYGRMKQKHLGSSAANLTVSGRMLNDMAVVETQRNRAILGFTSRGGSGGGGTFIQRSRSMGAADKAYFHHVSGAGRARTKRQFFDLSSREMAKVEKMVEQHLARVLRG
jgi:hypothetical protein